MNTLKKGGGDEKVKIIMDLINLDWYNQSQRNEIAQYFLKQIKKGGPSEESALQFISDNI